MRTFKICLLSLICGLLSCDIYAQETISDSLQASASSETSTSQYPLEANEALSRFRANYDDANYAEAIAIGEQVAKDFGVSPGLYYNLGNAYYKNKQYAQAILNYERCLLMDPSNNDARTNLELAQMQTIDRIESISPTIFELWSDALRNQLSESAWSYLAVSFVFLFVISLFVYFFSHRRILRKVGFFGAFFSLLFAILAHYYAGEQYEHLTSRNEAIVMSPSVTVRYSPAESGVKAFTLHEGTKVKVRETLGEWSEIELSDGSVGWIPSAHIERI